MNLNLRKTVVPVALAVGALSFVAVSCGDNQPSVEDQPDPGDRVGQQTFGQTGAGSGSGCTSGPLPVTTSVPSLSFFNGIYSVPGSDHVCRWLFPFDNNDDGIRRVKLELNGSTEGQTMTTDDQCLAQKAINGDMAGSVELCGPEIPIPGFDMNGFALRDYCKKCDESSGIFYCDGPRCSHAWATADFAPIKRSWTIKSRVWDLVDVETSGLGKLAKCILGVVCDITAEVGLSGSASIVQTEPGPKLFGCDGNTDPTNAACQKACTKRKTRLAPTWGLTGTCAFHGLKELISGSVTASGGGAISHYAWNAIPGHAETCQEGTCTESNLDFGFSTELKGDLPGWKNKTALRFSCTTEWRTDHQCNGPRPVDQPPVSNRPTLNCKLERPDELPLDKLTSLINAKECNL